ASMSREMLETGNYLEIYEQGSDYLDKPPLIFWLSSQSMRLFGATNFGYKLPSILFALLAIYATFRFARIFYDHTTAQLAALILATSQAFFLIANDVRTDTILTGCVIFAIWQLAEAFESGHWRHFLWGFIGIGLGLLAKGPIALLLPAMGFSVHFT
ncbi:MAG: phospholipid carrier-dependent glycosyltransferase, partial [Saprospiraceae bacterium]|nr:phospholipid carrier-dependent glycosyltransferase [Saprospiraceae bacterium]